MVYRALVCGVGLVSLAGCSSAPTQQQQQQNPPPAQYTGDDIGNRPMEACDVGQNAKGDCYPTTNIGFAPRAGGVPGNKIPNIRFLGWPNNDPATKTPSTGELKTISLADFYDPKAEKYRVIRIVVAGLWCGPCNAEADFIVQNNISTDLAPLGVVFLQALVEGAAPGVPSVTPDLTTWVSNHALNFSAALDGPDKLGIYWKANAIPQNITIDARSMEILARESGFSQGIKNELTNWVTWTKNNQPQL
jgi:hypothetical protein